MSDDKQRKKVLKSQFKQRERDDLQASIPVSLSELKDLLSHLNREDASECDHSLRETMKFLSKRGLNAETVIPWLGEHGGFCDCEVIYNVYNDVGDIVGWHLDEDT